MTKQAERPCLIDFRSRAFDDEDLATLQINANDVVEWETGECISELGASIFQVAFKGYPITHEGTLTTLESVLFDSCDHGLEIHNMIADALYEARHPWLDYRDALEKKAFEKLPHFHLITVYSNNDYHIGTTTGLNAIGDSSIVTAFKPIKPFDFHHFNDVKVYTPE